MKSLAKSYLDALSFSMADVSVIRALGEARGKQDLFIEQAPEQLETLRQTAIIQSSESSNRIEGVVAAEGRVAELVRDPSSPPRDRSEQEIAGYRDVLNLIHESHDSITFAPGVVLQLHGKLFRFQSDAGGRWKATDNEILEHHADGTTRVRFRATPAVATPYAMDALTAGHRRAIMDGCDPLVAIPLTILDFLCIHPFSDGNGRMARLMTLLLLYQARYRVGRFISLERVIEESKETYYETLERSSQGWHDGAHDAFPWMRYFWGVLTGASNEFEARIVRLRRTSRGDKTEHVRDAVMRRLGAFSMADIEADCPSVSRDMIRHVLRILRTEGVVETSGRGRSARWARR
jgi:Fic family protein